MMPTILLAVIVGAGALLAAGWWLRRQPEAPRPKGTHRTQCPRCRLSVRYGGHQVNHTVQCPGCAAFFKLPVPGREEAAWSPQTLARRSG